jgi:hypothetical protein
MSISGGAAISACLLQLGVYDPGETPSTSEQNQCLLILNQMLASWFNEQAQALALLLDAQNKAGLTYIAQQIRATSPVVAAYVLAGGTYTPPSYGAGSYTPGSAPQFPDLTSPQTFPEGYELAITKNGAVKLAPQYPGVGQLSDSLVKEAMDSLAAAVPIPGRLPVPGLEDQASVPPPGDVTSQAVAAPQG